MMYHAHISNGADACCACPPIASARNLQSEKKEFLYFELMRNTGNVIPMTCDYFQGSAWVLGCWVLFGVMHAPCVIFNFVWWYGGMVAWC